MQTREDPGMDRQPLRAAPGGVLLDALRCGTDGHADKVAASVIHEDVLSIEVEDVGHYALMWTPTRPEQAPFGYTQADGVLSEHGTPECLALALGFAFTEGLVDGIADVHAMWVCPERPDVVHVRLARPPAAAPRRRDVVINSGCGICGGREQLEAALTRPVPTDGALQLAVGDFVDLLGELRHRQQIFGRTGGAHGALAFDAGRGIVAFAEDLGRHNALDKIIGQCLLEGRPFAGLGVLVSSRLSYEMVSKAARAGFEVLAAISAPTSLAVSIAERAGITLCAFVRGETVEVFSHPRRIALARGPR